jgi:hypothetical protein
MQKNQEITKNTIYTYLKSNGLDPQLKTTSNNDVDIIDKTDVIQFQFKLDDVNYGTASLSLDNEGVLKIYNSDKIANSPKQSEHGGKTWNQVIQDLRKMTFGKVKSFELDDMDNLGYDMAKREHMKKLEEGYHSMGKKASYSDNIPECKIIIKHNRNIEEGEQRYRNIHQIFIENIMGERFLAPTTKPGLARVYARHIAEGGKVNDERWNHINSLCEEYNKMAGFVRATRNNQFNEDTQRLVEAGVNHYMTLRESLHKLANKRGYNTYFESWSAPLMEGESDKDLSEMFVNSSLDPRIESVIPILNRLNKTISENQEIKQVTELEEWADGVSEGRFEPHTANFGKQVLGHGKDWDEDPVGPSKWYKVYVSDGKEWSKKATFDHEMAAKTFIHQKVLAQNPNARVGIIDYTMKPGSQPRIVKGVVETSSAQRAATAINMKKHHKKPKSEDVSEDIGPQQQAVGQLGATSKVDAGGKVLGGPERSQKGLRGKLVGANESTETLKRIKRLSSL